MAQTQGGDMALDAAKLLEEARSQTGLDDFGDDSFREPMEVLVKALNEEANLNEIGRTSQHARIVGILVTRLQTQAWFTRYPEILEEEINAPVVIAGLPRTGSTMLHRVLASDSRFYAPIWYEVRFPSPALDWDFTPENDARIPAAKAEVQMMLEVNPDIAAMHPMDAMAPDEEIMLLENAFYSNMPPANAHVPSYSRFVIENDNTPAYIYMKQQLQFLQWQKKKTGVGAKAQRWLLMAPHHLHYMSTLLKVFPDVTVVQTHRDPLETIPSICSFSHALWRLSSDDVDPVVIADEWSDKWARGMLHTMETRKTAEDKFFDVMYEDSITDPDAVVASVYDFIGMELTEEARQAMDKWRDANRRELRPSHEYNMEDYGLTEEGLRQQFAEYRAAFFS